MKIKQFTLIELIMVMGVMMLLSAIAIPAYSSLFSGRKTTLAANVINSAIMTARARAISTKNYTAIVFIKTDLSANGYTSFRIAEVYHNSDMENNSFVWRRWAPDSSITYLPENTMIPSTKDDFGMVEGEGTHSTENPPRVTNLTNSGLGGQYAPAVIIKPNGQLAGTSDKNMIVRFVEVNRYKSNNKLTPKLPLNINWLTCKVKYLDPVE